MANFLDDLSIYNAKAAAAIALAVTEGNSPKANLMSSLKTTANDTTLSEGIRLEALTALINVGDLLDIPLPPYFPLTTTYADSQTYVGIHNDLSGLQGGGPGEYYHLTEAEKIGILNKASTTDITFANLLGSYTDNASLVAGFATKQDALSGTGYVKASGGTITYDNSIFLTTITGIAAGGDLTGTYPNPALSNAAVINQVLTGFNPNASGGVLSDSDSILSAIEKLNTNVNDVIASSGTINEITFTLPSSVFDYTPGPFTSGSAPLSGTFINQDQNTFFAGPLGGGTGQPEFRPFTAADLPLSGATAGTYGDATTVPQITVDGYGRVTSIENIPSATGGQVNTIAYSVPEGGPFSGSTTGTTDVTIFLGLETQAINTVWAGPATGASAAPSFRSLVAADIPTGIPIGNISGLGNALANKLDNSLNAGEIWIGNAANAPTNNSLTGDVLMDIDGVVAIQPNVVDFSKMQEITGADTSVVPNVPGNILGRWAAGVGNIQEIVLSSDFVLPYNTGVLSLAAPVAPVLDAKGGLITYRESIGQQVQLPAVFSGYLLITDSAEDDGLKWVEAQGDIEVDAALDGTFNITAGAVTLAKMANLSQVSFLGSNAAGPYPVQELTPAVATSMLNQFTTSAKGLVPAASGGLDDTYFLNATGGWSQPGGTGTVDSGTVGKLAIYTATTTVDSLASTNGSIFYTNSSGNVVPLAAGTDGKYLKLVGGYPSWEDVSGGSPGGVGTEIQYRSGASTFGGITDMQFVASKVNVISGTFQLVDDAASPTVGVTFDLAGAGSIETWTFPNAGATFVGEDLTQTLTNKTLSTGSKIDLGGAAQYDMWYSADTAGTIGVVAGGAGNVGKYLKYTTGGPVWEGVTATSTANISGGAANQILYQTGAGATGFITAPTTTNTYLKWNGSSIVWDTAGSGSGTVTSANQYSIPYYSLSPSGTTVIGLAPQTTNGIYFLRANVIASAAVAPDWASSTGTGNVVLASGPTISTSLTASYATASTIAIFDASKNLVSAGTGTYPDLTQLSYLKGVTSAIQTQIDGKEPTISTLSITKGGTNGNATPTLGGIAYGTGSAYAFTGVGTQGYILQSNNTSPPAWAQLQQGSGITITNTTGLITISSAASAPLLNQIQAATGTNTINNAANVQEWQWNTLASGNGFYLSSTSTAAASNTQTLFRVGLSGANATTTQSTYAAVISNTHTGTSSTNYALQLTASGGTQINYALDVTAGIVRIAAGTATAPQLILTPTTATPTGTTAGSLWYYENSGSEYLAIYKTTAALQTKIITKDTNPDFSTGASGVLVSDSSGTLTKSANLTALGIFAQTSTVTVANTTTPTTLIGTVTGSATLPANFFAVGKTIVIYVTGTYNTILSPSCVLALTIGGVSMGSITITHNNPVTNGYYNAQFVLTCRTTGATGTIQYSGIGILNTGTVSVSSFFQNSATSGSFDTTSAQAINLTATWNALSVSNSITASILTAQYLN